MVADTAYQVEARFKATFIPVVKKQAANPSGLLPVRQEKILIAPCFEPGIKIRAEGLARCTGDLVPVHDIFSERVIGCQIKTAAKMPMILVDQKKS